MKRIEEHVAQIKKLAASCNLSRQDIIDLFDIMEE